MDKINQNQQSASIKPPQYLTESERMELERKRRRRYILFAVLLLISGTIFLALFFLIGADAFSNLLEWQEGSRASAILRILFAMLAGLFWIISVLTLFKLASKAERARRQKPRS